PALSPRTNVRTHGYRGPPGPPSFPTRRSSDLQRAGRHVGVGENALHNLREVAAQQLQHRHVDGDVQVGEAVLAPAVQRQAGLAQDRKSTRLNSSHVKISYAVFCLKKKRKTVRA